MIDQPEIDRLDSQEQAEIGLWLKSHWLVLILGFAITIFILSLGLAYATSERQIFSKTTNEAVLSNQNGSLASKKVLVDVEGAVTKPGTYWLNPTDRVEQAIAAASGFDSQTVDRDYVARELNLAAKVSDGQKLYILHTGEDRSHIPTTVLGAATPAKINANSASPEELQTISGISATMANKIVLKRPYQKLEDLVTKKALTKTQLTKFQNSLWVN